MSNGLVKLANKHIVTVNLLLKWYVKGKKNSHFPFSSRLDYLMKTKIQQPHMEIKICIFMKFELSWKKAQKPAFDSTIINNEDIITYLNVHTHTT